MIKWNWDADFILISEFLEIPVVLAIIQNVEMTQSSAFGVASSSRSKLNVGSIFKVNFFLSIDKFYCVIISGNRVKIIKVKHPLHLSISNQHHILEFSKFFDVPKIQWIAGLFDLRHDVLEYLHIV